MKKPDKMTEFATAKHPIRSSLLPELFKCSRLFLEKTLTDGDYLADPLAQTGSLVHLGIQHYHQSGCSLQQGQKAIIEGKGKYPDGDADEAYNLLTKYIDREKTHPRGKVVKVEWEIKIEIPCSPLDKTKKAIVITGHIDQIRDLSDCIWVVDHKSGYRPGAGLISHYAPQMAAYMLGAHRHYKKPTKGFFTRLQDLKRRDLPFWWDCNFTDEHCLDVLMPVRNRIAEIRAGIVDCTGGKHCEYCPFEAYPACVTGNKVESGNTLPKRKMLTTVDALFGK